MKTYLDCIPCFFRQALAAARISSEDEAVHRRVLNAVALMIPDLALNATPPEIAQQVYRIVYEITGNNDPYIEAKKNANESALSLYTRMKDIVDYSNDTLETACKLAIAGNAIDLGPQSEFGSMYTIIEDSCGYKLNQEHYHRFKGCVGKASLVLYVADNAGEIVFDRILIEQMLKIKRLKIVLAVRAKPIINDATLDDALQIGLNKVTTVISSGSEAPATILSQCSPEMLSYFRAADLIISKGQGNYESLSSRPENIFFLFKVKCPVIAGDSGYDIDSPVVISSRMLKNAAHQNAVFDGSPAGGTA
ncbi:ARMT1-like domain-containing protein [bacterium]|nr:ARMT1-like domain-containing protein [bacterium]